MKKIKTPILGFLALAGIALSTIGASIVFANPQTVETDAAVGDYYAGISGQGKGLRDALNKKIKIRNNTGYDQLWETYKTSDIKPDGTINDIYSCTSRFIPDKDKAGNYSVEGDKYNREHCIPKSWWGGSTSNQGADPFIVFPSDGKVNGMRSSYAFGEVASIDNQSNKGYSKLGTSKISGGPGTVFEPNDQWKGDMARVYFYAITCYDEAPTWTGGSGKYVFDKNGTVGLTDYALNLFLKWHKQDPVDDWERHRCDEIFKINENRNPFIDHPEYVSAIWENKPITVEPYITIDSPFSLEIGESKKINAKVENGTGNITFRSENSSIASVDSTGLVKAIAKGSTNIVAEATVKGKTLTAKCAVTVTAPVVLEKLTMNKTSASIEMGETLNLSVTPTPSNASKNVTWSSSKTNIADVDQNGNVSGKAVGTATITATSSKDSSIKATCEVTVTKPLPVDGYKLVKTNLDDFSGEFMIAHKTTSGDLHVFSSTSNDAENSSVTGYTLDKNVIKTKKNTDALKFVKANGGYKITSPDGSLELVHGSGKKYSWAASGGTTFKINIANGNVEISNNGNYLAFNANTSSGIRFRFYDKADVNISLYKKSTSSGGGEGGGEVMPPDPPIEPEVPVEPTLTMPASLTLNINQTGSAEAVIHDGTGTITYSSDDQSVATVTNDGTVKGIKEGYAVITAKAVVGEKTLTATCQVKVSKPGNTAGFKLVTNINEVTDGKYVIAYQDKVLQASLTANGSLDKINNFITYSKTGDTFVKEAGADSVRLKHASDNKYYIYAGDTIIYNNTKDNDLLEATTEKADCQSSISFSGNNVIISGANKTKLEFNKQTDQNRFRFYKSSQQSIQLYKEVAASVPTTYGLAEFNFDFLSTVTCDNGVTPPSVAKWNIMAEKYNQLSAADKESLKILNYTNQDVGDALERYDLILSRYGDTNYVNFLNRVIKSDLLNNGNIEFDSMKLIMICSIAFVSCITIVGFAIICKTKRHKHN